MEVDKTLLRVAVSLSNLSQLDAVLLPRRTRRSQSVDVATPATPSVDDKSSGSLSGQRKERDPPIIVHGSVSVERELTLVPTPQLFRSVHTVPLLAFLTRMHESIVKQALTALTNVAEFDEEVRMVIVRHISKHHLLKLTTSQDLEVRCWSLAHSLASLCHTLFTDQNVFYLLAQLPVPIIGRSNKENDGHSCCGERPPATYPGNPRSHRAPCARIPGVIFCLGLPCV